MRTKKRTSFWSYLKGAPQETLALQIGDKESEISLCKHCGSDKIVRYGRYHDIQRWWCKECKRKFADNKAAPGMKTPLCQVSAAMSMYYEGVTLKDIHQYLRQQYNAYPADGTIYRWIQKVSKMGIMAADKCRPKVGNIWVAIEAVFEIGGQKVYCWDIIDARTYYLIVSQLFTERNTTSAKLLLKKAVARTGDVPSTIVSDRLIAYFDNIELKFGAEAKHIMARRLSTRAGVQFLERLQQALEVRAKIINRLKTIQSASNVVANWPLHYNYFRPAEVIQANTPAKKAGIKYPLRIKVR